MPTAVARSPVLAAPAPAPLAAPITAVPAAGARTSPLAEDPIGLPADVSILAAGPRDSSIRALRAAPLADIASLAPAEPITVPPAWHQPLPGPRLRSLLVSTAERARHRPGKSDAV